MKSIPIYWFYFTIFAFGLIIGSFLNVVAYRMPRGESVVSPPSRCPHCRRRLKPGELVPLLSWLVQRGRCRDCRKPIHWQYPLVEALTGLLFVLVGLRYGLGWETLVGLTLVGFLIPLSVIDLKTMLLPDRLTIPLLTIMVLYRLFIGTQPWWWYIIGGALGAGMLLLLAWLSPILFGKEGMGLGDVKLIAGIGVAVGPYGSVLTLFFASLFGIGFGLCYRYRLRRSLKLEADDESSGEFPFGPSLAVGGLVAYLYGDEIWQFYLSFLT
ncbi:MAG: prepilin peptidase [Bacillus thermozeamaize]|uniref:Prepilin leader peptidase/N-methyltransferase n=1 Tax=Bacillus thermozeamaize TaxID=230954 RepID=A0A1Y3PIP8_9BACI|nr:MAG: prepilin peptidase [Bacillus thermozeamaize]